MKIPVFDITRQNMEIGGELEEAVKEVLYSGSYILGRRVEELEEKFTKYIGVKYAIGVASGTDAITLALLALGIKEGDEVVMPANAYPSAFGVAASGAKIRLVDIDPETFNLDPERLEKAITKRTKAVLAVHLYGQPAEMRKILEIGRKHGVVVVEDSAQACGAEYNIQHPTFNIQQTRKCGSIGDIGCFSFYPTKNLGAFGDGGMVVTDNRRLYERVRLFRMYGERKRYESVLVGRNSRLDEMQAAILLVKLKYLVKWNERRMEIADIYRMQNAECRMQNKKHRSNYGILKVDCHCEPVRLVKQSPLETLTRLPRRPDTIETPRNDINRNSILLPIETANTKHVYHLFVVRTKEREKLRKYLLEKGIQTGIHYPTPIHLEPSFKYLGYKKGDFPESEKACKEMLSLPMWPELKDGEVEYICEAMMNFRRNG